MARNRTIKGDRPPSFLSKATLAAELDMSESTVDDYVRRGLLPAPIRMAGSLRWSWAQVESQLIAQCAGSADKFMEGIGNV